MTLVTADKFVGFGEDFCRPLRVSFLEIKSHEDEAVIFLFYSFWSIDHHIKVTAGVKK